MSKGSMEVPATGENFGVIWSNFPAIGKWLNPFNVEEIKPNYNLITAAAGENFENLPFLINFCVPFQQSENGRTLLMSRKVNRTTTARRRRKF
jgi:hypothetical protein